MFSSNSQILSYSVYFVTFMRLVLSADSETDWFERNNCQCIQGWSETTLPASYWRIPSSQADTVGRLACNTLHHNSSFAAPGYRRWNVLLIHKNIHFVPVMSWTLLFFTCFRTCKFSSLVQLSVGLPLMSCFLSPVVDWSHFPSLYENKPGYCYS